MDQRTRKPMTTYKVIHPRDDTDRLYVSRKGGGRGFDSIQDNVDASIQGLKDYINKHEGRLTTAIRNNTDNTSINRTEIIIKQKWKENNSMDTSSDKQAKSHTRKLGHDLDRENVREKLNLFW